MMTKARTPGMQIPRERRDRNPLITPAGYRRLAAILQHPAAPGWNYTVGDRIRREDIAAVEATRADLVRLRENGSGRPPGRILEWVQAMQARVPLFRHALPDGFDLVRDWAHIPTMSRQDIALRPEDIVPRDADLDRLIVYDTSGVTGHAIRVPHHPRAMGQNHPMIEFVLARYGVRPVFGHETVGCVNVGAQLNTVVFANIFSVWNQSGFAKVNLHPHRWDPDKARRFFSDMAPCFLTGDPIGFAGLMQWEVNIRPAAMLSTAVALTPAVKTRLESYFRCPVIDTYGSTETGPVAYANPEGEGLSILPHDLYVETIDTDGFPVAEGERGEICVSGGRNPYLPLLRYRTGDFGRMVWSKSVPSDCTPRIMDLEAREAVAFVAADGTPISPVDIGRVIRQWAFVQHEFIQHVDRSCSITIRPVAGYPVDAKAMREELETLFGKGIYVDVRVDEHLGDDRPGGKVVPFRCALA